MNELHRQSSSAGRIWRTIYWGGAAVLLTIPAFAMQVTDEVDWGSEDFFAMGILLALLGAGFELLVRFTRDTTRRVAIGALFVLVFLFVWAEMAVGLVGSPIAGS